MEKKNAPGILFPKNVADYINRTIFREMVEAARPALEAIDRAYQESFVERERQGENERRYKI